MTISQRLTRAGLTFILFGTVAAVLPQQSGAVRADTCVTPTGSYRLTSHADCTTDASTAIISNSPPTTIPLYTCFAADGTNFGPDSSNFSITVGNTATLSPSSGTTTTVSHANNGPGNDTVTSTSTQGSITYTAQYAITVSN